MLLKQITREDASKRTELLRIVDQQELIYFLGGDMPRWVGPNAGWFRADRDGGPAFYSVGPPDWRQMFGV